MNSLLKTGFQAKYLNPLYRRLLLDRQIFRVRSPPEKLASPEAPIEQRDTKKLDDMVETSDEPLLKVKTVFPFVLFTNEVVIDTHKVSIIYRNFFASEQIHSVLIRDISDVVVETSLFFATLKIVDIGYTDNSIDINYLKKSDGSLARKVIQGLAMVHRHNIDLTKVERTDLLNKLESLGASQKEE